MKIVFTGGFALIALGIVLYFIGASTSWVVFCVPLGVGLILMSMGNRVTFVIGIVLLIVAVLAFVIGLVGGDRQLPGLLP